MTRLLLIRHGATAGNVQKRYIGKTDEPLCEMGIKQIRSLQRQNLKANRLFVSPMRRTRQTAEILFPHMKYTVVQDLQEMNFGLFEGKNASELADNPTYQAWVASCCKGPIPDGECIADFKTRCCIAFREIMNTVDADDSVALVVHGGVMMAILEAFAQPHRDFFDYQINNGACVHGEYQADVITVSIPVRAHG